MEKERFILHKMKFILPALILSMAMSCCPPAAQSDSMTEGVSADGPASVLNGLARIGLTDRVSTMDVQKTTEDYMIPLNIYERLFDIKADADGNPEVVNGLARDYDVSEDGRTFLFTLREDAYFADGTNVKASDVAFTFSRMLSMKESVQTDFADMILGADEVMRGKADMPEGIRVLDDTHIQVELSDPFAGYIHLLAAPSCSILSESFVAKAGDSYGDSAETTIGSGPYMVTMFGEERITLERNPYYHCHEGEELSVSRAEILVLPPAIMNQTFRNGGLDLLDLNLINPDAAQEYLTSKEWGSRLTARGRVEIQYLMMNLEEGLLKDVRIRKAVQMAINRGRILEELYGGTGGSLMDGIFPKGLIGYCEENQGWLEYNPEEAKRLVSEVPGGDEFTLELAVNSQSNTRRLTMMEMIRQDLNAAGLNTVIVSYDSDSFMYLRKAGELMAYSSEWSADYNDPDNFIYTFFGNREKTLYRSSNYDNEGIFRRINDARAIQDEEARMAEYAFLERVLIRDEAAWVPLLSSDHFFVLGSRLESFSPFWAGWSSMYLRDIVLKEENR